MRDSVATMHIFAGESEDPPLDTEAYFGEDDESVVYVTTALRLGSLTISGEVQRVREYLQAQLDAIDDAASSSALAAGEIDTLLEEAEQAEIEGVADPTTADLQEALSEIEAEG